MAQQEEPLYDFPEPTQLSDRTCVGLQKGRDSLRSVSVLDRLLLTVPVWLQLSINPATALHILQREPPGAFLVRKSRTSKRNVLCVRLVDHSVPSFVQQFGIREEHSTFSLETSAISFPDVPRLIAFYCVSRDVLPFPLELPEAIARATSHKQLESISHMGIEFWSSQLNFRGPREAPKAQEDEESIPTSQPNAAMQMTSAAGPNPATHLDNQLSTPPQTDTLANQLKANPTLFQEFCPISTRSPRELNCGPGLVALCFVNPLFLQSQNILHRKRRFKRSIKVRVSTETSSPLSPPLAPPPPPPLMPKAKGKCKSRAQTQGQPLGHPLEGLCPLQSQTQGEPKPQDAQLQPQIPNTHDVQAQDAQLQPQMPNTLDVQAQAQDAHVEAEAQPQSPPPKPKLPPAHFLSLMQRQDQTQDQTQIEERQGRFGPGEAEAQVTITTDLLPDDSDYMQPSPRVNVSLSPSLSPYLSPSPSTGGPPSLFPKVSPSLSPHNSPGGSPSLSPYQYPSVSPYQSPSVSPYQSPSVSPYQSPSVSPYQYPSVSPYQSPSVSPKPPLSPFTSPTVEAYHTPATLLTLDQLRRRGQDDEEKGDGKEGDNDEEPGSEEEEAAKEGEEEMSLLLQQIYASSLNEMDSCSSLSSLEEAAETPPPSPLVQDSGSSPGLR